MQVKGNTYLLYSLYRYVLDRIMQTMTFVYSQVVYDKSILAKLGSKDKVIAYWNAAAPHIQARYCHASLGTKIKFERIGNFEYLDQKIVASSAGLEAVKPHAPKVIGSADLVVYMANDESSLWGTIGIAWCPVICGPSYHNAWKTSINEWRPDSISYGGVKLFLSFIKRYLYIFL